MAGQGGRPSSNVKLDLLKQGHAFSFIQVMRLLRSFSAPSKNQDASGVEGMEHIRVRPKLSLAFPPADVDRIEQEEQEEPQYLVTVTFLGLYGSASPLPTFYTEDLLDDASQDESVAREFLDIINHRLFLLLFQCWTKYRQFIKVVEENETAHLERLFSLLGLGEKPLRDDVPDAYALIRYVGLFTQFPRSAGGLKALLQDAFGNIPIKVVPCVTRKAKIPEGQRFFLGSSDKVLGSDSFIGEEIEDRMGKFRLQAGPLDQQQFQRLLPGMERGNKLALLTRLYVTDPLEYDVELTLAEGQAQCARLGGSAWSRLGWDTWIFSGKQMGTVTVTFQLEQ
ncbi:MAG: type VI secretion system baseplate subunit TssG [Deltaproteobacteria bacterium]|nr:type VI secretion system baseplate subunit TssG [Deltaproteobacteria bacterium]